MANENGFVEYKSLNMEVKEIELEVKSKKITYIKQRLFLLSF